jgi:predicted nucleic acid-binding protein
MNEINRISGAKCFVDTNIWLYSFIQSQHPEKTLISSHIIRNCDCTISTQIINEISVNLIRKANFTEKQITDLILSLYKRFTVLELSKEILIIASKIRNTYQFSFWDSLIVASALDSDVNYLITEDMQHGFRLENRLTIFNPFK